MRLVDLLTYRGLLIALNAAVVLGALFVMLLVQSVPWLLLAAPVFGLLAFATAQRHKPLLVGAAISNSLVLLASTPFLYFAVVNGATFGWFTLGALAAFVVPALTVFNCWARWPRAAVV